MSGIKTDEAEKTRLENLAFKIANKYCEPQIDLPQESAGTFYLLLDLMTFFNYYRTNLYAEALDTIYKLKILPATQKEVEVKSRQFNRYPVEIRLNIPDILMATMNMLYASYKEQPSLEVKDKAKALITFSGMIQYRLPSDAIARMLELEVLIN
jgi:nuclear pore complex protein Nup93